MRGLKTTIALAVVLAGLTSYIYFIDSKKPSGTTAKDKAFTVTADAIEDIQIKASDGDMTHLQKANGAWSVVTPLQVAAESSESTSITSNLSTVEIQRVVDANPASLSDYGLDPPRVDVAFRAKGDLKLRHLFIGQKTPTGQELYAKKDDAKTVFLVAAYLDNTFNRTTFDLRDKSILKFNRDKVQNIQVMQGSQPTLQFVRKGEMDWQIVKPFDSRADYGAIEGLIGSLFSTQVQKFVSENPTDLAQYGLASPAVTLALTSDGENRSLLIGKLDGDVRYAKDSTRPVVFTLGDAFVMSLERGVEEFRRKDLFEFRFLTVKRLEFRRGTNTISVERVPDKDSWRTASGKEIDGTTAEASLLKISGLRADSFEATQPDALKSPDLVVTVTPADSAKKPEVLSFVKVGQDVYVARANEPGAGKIIATPYDDALKALDALK